MKESTQGGGAKRRPPVWRRRFAPPPSWMGVDVCVAVAVAEAVAVAVAVAVPSLSAQLTSSFFSEKLASDGLKRKFSKEKWSLHGKY